MEEKHAGGRPPKFKTAEEMQEVIDKYFNSCFHPILNKSGDIMRNEKTGEPYLEQYKPFTMSGLAESLDMSRQSLLNYEEKDEFFNTITRAKRKIEVYTEERLFDKDGNKGAIFSLYNNFSGWKEKQEVDANVNNEIRVTLIDD